MGVKNHGFPLALVNPKLQGVDPFSKELTAEQAGMISFECRINPWYYFREIARAPARSGSEPGLFLANRGNMCLFWVYFNHIFITLIQPRQTGKSLSLDQLVAYLLNIRCRKSNINLLTKDDTLRRQNVKRLKDIIDVLPPYLNQVGKEGSKNSENITSASLGNAFQTFLPQMSIARANNVGRGMTTETMLFDEGPFQPLFNIAFPAAMASAGAAHDIAKAKNEPYGVICTTTAGKIDDESGAFFYNELLQTAAHWDDPFFLDSLDRDDLVKRVVSMCRKSQNYEQDGTKEHLVVIPRINATFSHRQLGYTDDWLREKIAAAVGPRDGAERDYLNRWTNGQANSPFSAETTNRIIKSERKVVFKDFDDKRNFLLNWYIPENQIEHVMAHRDVVLGMDSSDAVGNDSMGVTLSDTRSLGTIASATLNNMTIFGFSEWIADLLLRFPRLVWIPERKSSGMSIIDHVSEILMSHNQDPFRRIFNRIVQEKENFPEAYDEIKRPLYNRKSDFYNRHKGLLGFNTAGQGEYARSRLYGSVLSSMTQRFAENIFDKTLIQQLMGLSVKDGRIDHGVNGHDDLVISWLLVGWLMLFGKNLHHYGINAAAILTEEPEVLKEKNIPQIVKNNQRAQALLQERITELLERLSKEREEFIVAQLERELKFLDSKLVKDVSAVNSMQSLIDKAKEQRLKNRRDVNSRLDQRDPRDRLSAYKEMYMMSAHR